MGENLEKAKLEWNRIHPEYNLDSVEIFAVLFQVSNIIDKKRCGFLKEIGLAPWSFDTLSLLRRSQGKILTPSQFIKELGITSGTMTHRIDMLEKEGFVVRKKNENDGRSFPVELTEKGQVLIEKALKKYIYESDLLFSNFSMNEKKIIFKVMKELLIKLKES